jgi:3-oxoacyl-[acyl-carrier-protein] synthase-3
VFRSTFSVVISVVPLPPAHAPGGVRAVPGAAAVLCGVGAHLPARSVGNDELSARLDTTDAWIRERTGIERRHVVDPGTATSDLAVEAGAAALVCAGVDSVDAVVLATTTPDHRCPATAPAVARRLGLGPVAAFDVGAVCSGFVYGLATAVGFVASGLAERVLLVGADTFSTILHPDDRDSGVVFGDGAGAVVLRRGDPDEPGAVRAVDLGSDGDLADLITIPAGGSRRPGPATATDDLRDHAFTMAGRAVYRHAVRTLGASSRRALEAAGWTAPGVDRFVLHQANARILAAVARELDVEPNRLLANIDRVGNTAAASIPLLLAHAWQRGHLEAGQKVVLSAFGGGAAWGSAALVWPRLP